MNRHARPLVALLSAVLCYCAAQPSARAAEPDPRPAPPAVTPLRPYTAFVWNFAGLRERIKPMYVMRKSTPPGVAAQATARMPAGSRVVLTVEFGHDVLDHPGDACRGPDNKLTGQQGVWPTLGVRAAADEFDAYLRDFAKVGGQVDLLALDYEGTFSCWTMTEARLAAIGVDPRFPDLAARLGFDDVRKAMPQNSTARGEYLRWNAVGDRAVADAVDQALLVPLRRHFPRAGMSNFEGVAMTRENVVPELNGHLQYRLGEPVGTHQSPAINGGISATAAVPQVNWERPFVQVVYAANYARSAVRSSRRPLIPWVSPRSLHPAGAPGRPTYWGNTDYWQEGVFHALLSGATTNVLYWNPQSLLPWPANLTDPNAAKAADSDALEAVLAEMEREAGGQPLAAPATVDASPWDPPTLVSAAALPDGSTLARVTFAEKEQAATVTVAGREVKVARPAGKLGTWVRVPGAAAGKR